MNILANALTIIAMLFSMTTTVQSYTGGKKSHKAQLHRAPCPCTKKQTKQKPKESNQKKACCDNCAKHLNNPAAQKPPCSCK